MLEHLTQRYVPAPRLRRTMRPAALARHVRSIRKYRRRAAVANGLRPRGDWPNFIGEPATQSAVRWLDTPLPSRVLGLLT